MSDRDLTVNGLAHRSSTLQLMQDDTKSRRRLRTASEAYDIGPAPVGGRGEKMMDRPLTTRSTGKVKDMWFSKAHHSVFSMTGVEALLSKMESFTSQTENDSPRLKAAESIGMVGSPLGDARSSYPEFVDEASITGPTFNILARPEDMSEKDWEENIRQWENQGKWVECRETLTGRILWYNTNTYRMVFDAPPSDEIVPIPQAEIAYQSGASHDDYLATRPICPGEGEDVVQGLLNFGMHEWDFINDIVDCYRHKASRRDHHKMLPKPKQYAFPEYFSMMPLPERPGNKFIARIRLPAAYSAHRRHVSVSIKMDHTSAQDVIKQGVQRLDKEHHVDETDFILKVVGREEYMYGRTKIVDYEAVRQAVRNEDDVEFVIVKRPDFKQKIEEAKAKQKEYEKEFQEAYPKRVREPGFIAEEDIISNLQDLKGGNEFEPVEFLSLYECDWNYRIKIRGVTNIMALPRFDDSTMKNVYVTSEVWCGETCIDAATLSTEPQNVANSLTWDKWLSNKNASLSQFPREATVCFMVMSRDTNGIEQCLAWARLPLIDHRHRLRRGRYLVNLWEIPEFKLVKDGPKTDPFLPRAFRFRGTTRDKNLSRPDPDQCQLLVEFDEFAFDVVAPLEPPPPPARGAGIKLTRDQLTDKQKIRISEIIDTDPLAPLDHKEKELIWSARDLLWHDPKALPAFLRSVNWSNRAQIAEAHKFLDTWHPPKEPADALEFLDYRFADSKVREKAVKWLQDMHDGELQLYLLQLTQALKYENHHESPLSRFLIQRALQNPYQIGHYLFWHLKAEYHDLQFAERFGVLMEEYLKHAGEHARQIYIQSTVLKRLEVIAEKVFKAKHSMSKEACKKLMKRELNKLNKELPDFIQIPLNPRWSARKIVVEKCRFMSSKKVPLWLAFENADQYAQNIEVMFKSGDDLRQDMLTLQILSVMDNIWLHNNLDLRLKPYKVLATGVNKHGEGVGMLEIVLNSETINTINVKNGGSLNKETINSFIVHHNKGDTDQKKARENFARSCAGYCVATFVMGIGDRHSDNIMIKYNGQLFHIDFGHFLGNFKSKKIIGISVNRERSPFVFTPQMKFAIDQGKRSVPLFNDFMEWVSEAYNVLRMRSRLLLVLFALMVSAGMPELMQESDIAYLTNMLKLNLEPKKARSHVQKLVNSSVKDWMRILDNRIHQAVHS